MTTENNTPENTTEEDGADIDTTPQVIDPNQNDIEGSDNGDISDMDTKEQDTKREGTSENLNLETSTSAEIVTAKKFLALSLQAFAAKQFEEAGALFAQAAECSDITRLTNALLEPVTGHLPSTQAPITGENQQQLASEDEDEEDEGEEWDEEGEDSDAEADLESESSEHKPSPIRRRVTSMHQIGKILAASMEATSSENLEDSGEVEPEPEAELGSESGEDEGLDIEADPDVPGEQLIPVSFSSVKIKKGLDVKSPVKLKQ